MGVIGNSTHGVKFVPVTQTLETKLRHNHIIGATGTGKSTLLENLALQDMEAGYGVCVIDPHGERAERALELVPEDRKDDVLYFNVADFERPVGFNPFYGATRDTVPRIADGLIYAFASLWSDTWGSSRMQFLIKASGVPLIEHGDTTILGIERFITDEQYRDRILQKSHNPSAKRYWQKVFAEYKAQQQNENTSPLFHHLGQLSIDFVARNIIGQKKDRLRLRELMDESKILIVNLSSGKVGRTNSDFLGSLLVAFFQLAAMSRADSDDYPPFFLYIDEFQNFATTSFADVLSEARKYGLGITLAHQYFGQVDEAVQKAVLGNTGTLISFRVGSNDAEILSENTEYSQEAFVELARFNTLVRMEQGDEVSSYPIRTDPPPVGDPEIAKAIKKESRKRYGKPRREIEDKLRRFYS